MEMTAPRIDPARPVLRRHMDDVVSSCAPVTDPRTGAVDE